MEKMRNCALYDKSPTFQRRFQYLTSWNGVLFLVHPDNRTLVDFLANSKIAPSTLVFKAQGTFFLKLFFFCLGLFMVYTSSDFLLQPLALAPV